MKAIPSLVVCLLFLAVGVNAHDHASMTAEHDPEALARAYIEAHSVHGPVIPQPDVVQATAVKTFNMVAKSFEFDITPPQFVVNQGDTVTINLSVPSNDPASGHGLLMETYVETPVLINKGQTKTITFTATTVGEFAFACSVTTCGIGHDNMFGSFVVQAAIVQPPQVSSINPVTGLTAGGTAVTITGTNFQSNATVKFGGVAATNVSVNSSTTITATAPAHAAGAVDVVVTNPDAQSGTLANGFTYAVPAPTVASIAPATGPTSGFTPVTITGTNFQQGATVTIGGIAATKVTVVSATSITAVTPLGPANEQLLAKDVVVTNPDNSKGTLAAGFQYSVPPLSIKLVTPSAALPAGGSKVSISGTGFTSALQSSITIGGVAATNVAVVDAVTMTATVPAHAVGPVDVVVNIGGTAVTAKGLFGYVNAMPRKHPVKH